MTILMDKDARREHVVPFDGAELRAAEGKATRKGKSNGFIEGYAAVWDNVDLQGEIVRRGSTQKSIQERVAAGKVKLMAQHLAFGGGTKEVIGTITEMKEDDFGLWFHAELAKTQLAQDMRSLVVDEHVQGASIGFLPIRWGFITDQETGKEFVELTEMKVLEVTITAFPVNELAVLTGAKDMSPAAIKLVQDKLSKLDVSTLDAEAKSRAIQELFGSRDGAVAYQSELTALGKSLNGLVEEGEPVEAKALDYEVIATQTDNARLELDKLLLE